MSSVARTCFFQQLFLEVGNFDKRILNCVLRGDNAEDLLLQSQVPCFAGSILWLGMDISASPSINGTVYLACFSAPQLSAHSCETHPQSTLQALDTTNDWCEGGQTAYSSYQRLQTPRTANRGWNGGISCQWSVHNVQCALLNNNLKNIKIW